MDKDRFLVSVALGAIDGAAIGITLMIVFFGALWLIALLFS